MSLTAIQLENMAYFDKLATDPEAAQERGARVLRDHIKEGAFNRQIIPMESIGPGAPGLQVSLEHDTFEKIEWLEPQSRAMKLTYRNSGDARLITAPKMAMGFYTIQSEKFEGIVEELMTYPFSITKMLEENAPLDIETIEDREWTLSIEAAVQLLQRERNGGVVTTLNTSAINGGTVIEHSVVKGERARNAGVDNAVPLNLEKPDIMSLKRLHTIKKNRAYAMLINEHDLASVDSWTLEDQGFKVEQTTEEGWKGSKLGGLTIVRSIKVDVLRLGNVYSFARPNYLGRSYQLGQLQFFARREGNKIMWWCWETIAQAILQAVGVNKLELYSGDATSNDADSILASVIPLAESEMGRYQGLAHVGETIPKLILF